MLGRVRGETFHILGRHPAAACLTTLALAAITAVVIGPITLLALVLIVGLTAIPGWLVAAYLLVPFLYKAGLQPYVAFDLTVGLAVATIVVAARLLIIQRPRRAAATPLVLWSGLALLIVVGVFVAADTSNALREAAYWIALAYLPLFAVVGIGGSASYLRQFLVATLVICLPFVLGGVLALALSGLDPARDFVRLFGANYIGVSRASFLAALLLMGYPGSSIAERSRSVRLLLFLAAVLIGVAAGARGPVLAFLVVAIGWMLVRLFHSQDRSRAAKRAVLPMAVALVAAVGAASLLFPVVSSRFGLLLSYAGSLLGIGEASGGASISVRVAAYQLAADLFRSEPVVGAGTGAYAAAARNHPIIFNFEYPHNLVLQFAAEFGLAGLILFAIALIAAFGRPIPSASAWATVRSVAVFLALGGLISNGIYEYRIFWGFLLLLIAVPVSDRLGDVRLHWPFANQRGG